MLASIFVEGFVGRWIFHRFLKKLFIRYKGKKQLLILADNLDAHKVAEVKLLCMESSNVFVLNVPYFSCSNPIEFFFGLLKKRLRHMVIDNKDHIVQQVKFVMNDFSKDELRSRFSLGFKKTISCLQKELESY